MRPFTAWFKALTASPGVVEALQDRRTNFYPALGGTNTQQMRFAFERGLAATYGWMYMRQPAVRAVVDYVARNVSQLPLKLFERIADEERERREDHPAAQTMANPDGRTPADAFIFRFVADWLVYDNAYALKFRNPGTQRLILVRLPPAGVTVGGGRFEPDYYRIYRVDGTFFDVQPRNILHWQGYNPEDPLMGLSKLETLRQELTGDAVLQSTLTELAKQGLHSGHIERPNEAPQWSDQARERFQESWKIQKTRPDIDGVLEEGMRYVRDAITPEDAQLLDSRKFTIAEVARVYGVPPGALGLEPATDLAEQRKQVYADVLPPITKTLACQLDVSILQDEYSETDFYFEFDLNEKLRGDLENRFQAITASVGRPWQSVNEARAREGLPPVEGGDALSVPLNITLEGPGSPALPAPNVMPPQDPNKPPQDGSYRQNALTNGREIIERKQFHITTQPRRVADMARQRRSIDKSKAVFEPYYRRQLRVMEQKGLKAADSQRWNDDLARRLIKLIRHVVELEGGIYVSRLGGNDFDMREVEHWLEETAIGTAEAINIATQRDISETSVKEAFDRALALRVGTAGTSIGARTTLFARREAAKQSPHPERRMQTWIADTDRHADLDGISVPLGSDWGGIEPGSEPNCACSASIG